jgi:acyl-coenzyme A synthetase/AMP-(fatty) acid ligase
VVTRTSATCNENDLQSYVKDRLASYKTPRFVRFIDALPRNPSGKVVRAALKALLTSPGA